MLTAIRAGSYPDIAYLYGSWAANMATQPKVVDLTPLIKPSPTSTGTTSGRPSGRR